MTTKRRSAGEGTISEYRTANGQRRYLIKVYVPQAGSDKKKPLLRRRNKAGEPFTTKKEAAAGIRELINEGEKAGGYVEPSKATVAEYLGQWLDGLQLAESTIASYRRTMRLHVTPHIGGVPLVKLTATQISKHYRDLESGGLGPRTVRYTGTILGAAMKAAVEDGLIATSPAVAARRSLPTAQRAKGREMTVWSAEQVATFTSWARGEVDQEQLTGWLVLLATGMRRGELLALRWKDVDLDSGTIAVRRSVGMVKVKGERDRLVEGPTKNKRARSVAIDAGTVELLRTYRRGRAAAAFTLGTEEALVFGNAEGKHRLPDSFSWYFTDSVRRCNAALAAGDGTRELEQLPSLRMHDLRHSHATLALAAGVHPKIVQERLGHSSVMVTMDIYSHALPSMQRDAADTIGAAIYGAAVSG